MPNEGSALRMPVQDTGKYQNCLQPPITAWVFSSLLPLLGRNQGPYLGRGKGDLEESSQVQRVPWCQGKVEMRGMNQKTASGWGRGLTWAAEGFTVHCSAQKNCQQKFAPSFPPVHGITAGQGWRDHGHFSTTLGLELSSLNPLLTWRPTSLFLPLLPVPSPLLLVPWPWPFSRPQFPFEPSGEAGEGMVSNICPAKTYKDVPFLGGISPHSLALFWRMVETLWWRAGVCTAASPSCLSGLSG